jgi:hypothetical protein
MDGTFGLLCLPRPLTIRIGRGTDSQGHGYRSRMTRRFRFHRPEEDAWHWFETTADGHPARQLTLLGADAVPAVAVDFAELARLRDSCGPLGVRLYEVVYGVAVPGRAERPPDAEPVTEREFAVMWGRCRSHRQCDVTHSGGPVPVGTRLHGTFVGAPWPPGRTGVFVDLGLPLPGFVDAIHLFRADCAWPPDGTRAEFEVVDIRVGGSPQLRLRPTVCPPPGEPWPRPGRP